MHAEALAYATGWLANRSYGAVVEVGGRNINGGVRHLFDAGTYISLDLHDGPGVDVVADCRDWKPDQPADLVICLEVLEHAPDPAGVVAACVSYLAPGGRLLVTAAGPGRAPHSGLDGGTVRAGEHYANIDPYELRSWLAGLDDVQVVQQGPDVYATGVAP